jgi:hypothetical protein
MVSLLCVYLFYCIPKCLVRQVVGSLGAEKAAPAEVHFADSPKDLPFLSLIPYLSRPCLRSVTLPRGEGVGVEIGGLALIYSTFYVRNLSKNVETFWDVQFLQEFARILSDDCSYLFLQNLLHYVKLSMSHRSGLDASVWGEI